MIYIFPYKKKSRSAGRLARVLSGIKMNPELPSGVKEDDVVINYGSSKCPFGHKSVTTLNPQNRVANATNKKRAFKILSQSGVRVPEFAFRPEDVSWKGDVVVRLLLQGHSGKGIKIFPRGVELPSAGLFVEYINKSDEYRVHVMRGEVILVQRKARRKSVDDADVNWKVRTHNNGFVYVRHGINPPKAVIEESLKAMNALELDFGAVDVIWNQKRGAFVLEVNTAPGLEGTTVVDYARAIEKFMEERQ